MSKLLGRELTLDEVINPVIANMAAVFGFEPDVTLIRSGGDH